MESRAMRATSIAILLAASATPALAQSNSPWSFGGSIGYDIPVSGSAFAADDSNSLNLSTLNANLTGTGILRLRGTDFKDAYDPALRATIEVRYALSDMSEVFGAFTYTKAEGKKVSIGCIKTTVECAYNLSATLADLDQRGIEIGYRQWLNFSMLGDYVRPYVAFRAGATKTKDINGVIQAGTVDISRWRLYKEGVSYSLGGDLGATVALSPNIELGGEVGVRYLSKLKERDTDYGAIGLGETNDKADIISIPVSLRINAAF
jgi:hypothetical protein